MQRIDDPRFLRAFSRFAGWPSRHLDGCRLFVEMSGTTITVIIASEISALLRFEWTRRRARLLPGSRLLRPDDLWALEDALTFQIERFLRRHGFLDGRINRRHTA